MRHPIISILFGLSGLAAQAQSSALRTSDRYMLVFGTGADGPYLYAQPDSAAQDERWPERSSALWAFDMYLFDNHARASREQQQLDALLPDSVAIRSRFVGMLEADTVFKRMFEQAMPDHRVPSVHIDSLMRICARFYYLHREGKGVSLHVCSGINRVRELPRSVGAPYYEAFCYQTIHEQPDPHLFFHRVKDRLAEKIHKGMSDDRLLAAEQEIYDRIAKDPELRKLLLATYAAKRQFLNFEVEQ